MGKRLKIKTAFTFKLASGGFAGGVVTHLGPGLIGLAVISTHKFNEMPTLTQLEEKLNLEPWFREIISNYGYRTGRWMSLGTFENLDDEWQKLPLFYMSEHIPIVEFTETFHVGKRHFRGDIEGREVMDYAIPGPNITETFVERVLNLDPESQQKRLDRYRKGAPHYG